VEAITGVLAFDKTNTEALRIYIFYLLARENDAELVQEKMNELTQALKKIEGKNSELIYNVSRLFARYSSRKEWIITKTLQLLDIAIMLQPENPHYHAEVGF